ncbi:TenA family protein [Brachybacterium sp. DNPG3]
MEEPRSNAPATAVDAVTATTAVPAKTTVTATTAFTARLREEASPAWDLAVGHRFVRELHVGTVPDDVMAGYLVQDHRFLDSFLMLIGAAIATADTPAARLRLAQFAGDVAGEENTYFLRSFDALGIDEDRRASIPDAPATAGFLALFREAAASGDYAVALAVLLVTEWLYNDWAAAAPRPLPADFVHAEWIVLHDNPGFEEFVGFLRAELDRVGASLEAADGAASSAAEGEAGGASDGAFAGVRLAAVREAFARTVSLELEFFDAAYEDARVPSARRVLEGAVR